MKLKELFKKSLNDGEQVIIELSGVTEAGNRKMFDITNPADKGSSMFIVDSFTCNQSGGTAPLFLIDANPCVYTEAGGKFRTEYGFVTNKVQMTGTGVGQIIGMILIGRYIDRKKITKV